MCSWKKFFVSEAMDATWNESTIWNDLDTWRGGGVHYRRFYRSAIYTHVQVVQVIEIFLAQPTETTRDGSCFMLTRMGSISK